MANRPHHRDTRPGCAAILAAVMIVILAGTPAVATAHGVYLARTDGRAVTLHAGYSSGEPVAYGEVTVLAPGGEGVEFQSGRTDRNGDFAFMPDVTGPWRITVDAGMGHRARLDMNVGSTAASTSPPSRPGADPLRILLGCSLLANVGLLAARRKTLSKPKHAS